jgi:hypothetical protein
MWWYMSVIPVLRRLRQENVEFRASLDYIVSLFLSLSLKNKIKIQSLKKYEK